MRRFLTGWSSVLDELCFKKYKGEANPIRKIRENQIQSALTFDVETKTMI